MDPVQIRIEAEVQDALTKILKVRTDFIGFKEDYKKAVSEMAAVSNKFSGDQLTRTATQYMKAIEQFGGVQKLTVAEQAKVNKVLTEAAEKYRLLGREVPQAMQQMIAATSQAAAKQSQDAQKILSAISGDKLIQQANAYVAAIQKIGGASALTISEQAKVNKILDEAAAKYRALGQEVPAAIQKIINETTKVKLAKDEFAKLRDSLSGQTIQREAQAYIKIINDIGGASKLTAAEQKKALDVLTKYEAKLVSTGNTVPPALRKITDEIKKLQPARDELKKLEDSLSGRDAIRNANGYIQVIQRIGGVTKLTADEQKKVNSALNEAAAKYRALGQQVPAELQRIINVTKENGNSTDSFFDQLWFQIAKGSTVGNLAANTLAAAWRGVKDAVASAVAMIVEFGERGAEVQRVKGAFESLVPTVQRVVNGISIPESSERVLTETRKALKGLANDFDIMAAANKAALFGIPLTAEKFTVLAKSAVTLGRAMNIDAGKSLDDLIIALGRTSPRILDNLGIIVKVTEANEKYAKSIGKNRLELSAEERTLAFTQEALRKMQERVEDLGDINLNFADRLKVVKVELQNVRDRIGSIIAVNPVLNTAIERAGQIFMNAFGPTTQLQIRTLTKLINEMVIVTVSLIGDVALPMLSGFVQMITFAITGLMEFQAQLIDQADRAFNILFKIGELQSKIPGAIGDTGRQLAIAAAQGKQILKDLLPNPVEQLKRANGIQKASDQVVDSLSRMSVAFKFLKKDLEDLRNAPLLEPKDVLPPITNNDLANAEEGMKKLTKAEAAWIDAFEKSKQKYVLETQDLVRWYDQYVLKHDKQRNEYNQRILDRLSSQNVNKVLGPGGTEELRRSQEEYDRINARGTKNIVDIMKQMDTFTTKVGSLPKLKGEFNRAFASIFTDLPQVISRAIQGGGDVSKAITTTIFGGLGKEMFSLEGSIGKALSKLGNKLGPNIGKAFGQAIPFVGEMLGQLAGMGINKLIETFKKPGWKDSMKVVARDWGVTITEELAKTIEETAKKKFGGDRRAAELFHFADIIKDEGITSANFDKMAARLRDVFVMVQTGKFTVDQARKVLDSSFGLFAEHLQKTGEIASKQFLELIELNQQLGIESKAVADFIDSQASRLSSGLGRMTAVIASRYKDLGERVKSAKDELEKINKEIADAGGESRVDQGTLDRRRKAQEDYNKVLLEQKKSAGEAREEFERLGRLSLAAFNALEKKGLTTSQILAQLGPSFQNLVELQKALGIESQNAAVKELLDLAAKREANKELFEAAGAVNETAIALANLNGMSQESFNDLAAQAASMKDQFMAAGLTERQALAELAPFLRTALRLQQERGIEIDEQTQSLIDQAKAYDVLGEDAKSQSDIMKDGFSAINDGLAALIETLGGKVPDSLKKMADAATDEAKRAKTGVDGIKDGALIAAGAVEQISRKMGGVARSLEEVDFETWAAEASRALEDLSYDVDAISLGHSPGGLKEIPIKAQEAISAFQQMFRNSQGELNQLYQLINAINPNIGATIPVVNVDTKGDQQNLYLEQIRDLLLNKKQSFELHINGTMVAGGDLERLAGAMTPMILDNIDRGGESGARFTRMVNAR